MTVATLRKATLADAETLGALHVASWKETYTGLLPEEILAEMSIDARSTMWRTILGAPDNFGCAAVIIAEDNGHAIGFGSCGQQRDAALTGAGFSGEFSAIYVLRSHQGRGIGKSIFAAMARELCAVGHSDASLWVLRENEHAQAFYDRLGGIIVGEKTDQRPHGTIIEDVYGWRDLASLVR